MEAPEDTAAASIRALVGAEVLRRRAAEARRQRLAEGEQEARERLATVLGREIDRPTFERLAALPAWARRRLPALAPCPNADQVAGVPAPFVFRVVGADGTVARCVDARLLNHLERLGGATVLRDALTYVVLDALAPDVMPDDVSGAVSEAVDVNAARFKARWRQVDPERGVEPPPAGWLSATMRPALSGPPGLSAAGNAAAWAADPAGQRLRYATVAPEAGGEIAQAIGIGESPIVLPPALFGQWYAAVTESPVVPAAVSGLGARPAAPTLPADAAGPLVRVTYEQPRGSGRLVRTLATRIGADDASGRRIYADVFGTTMGLARDEIVEETPAQPFIGIAAYSTDPALPGTAYGYAVAGDARMPATEALVPYDVLWNLWGGSEPPVATTAASLPPPLAAAAEAIRTSGDPSDIVLAPSIFPLGAAIVLAPAARDAQEALDAYARATAGPLAEARPSPIERVLDRAYMLADGQMLVVPPQLWEPARVPRPVAFVVRRLFGYVRRAPHAPGAYEVARVPAITIGGGRGGSLYAVDMEPAEVPTPATSHDALAAYYAAGPSGRPRSESPVGDAAEATAVEAALRAQIQSGGLAVGLTGALPPTLAVIMASREAPTPRERAHWSQFMRRLARDADDMLPEPPRAVPPRTLAGLHVAPLAGAAPGAGSLSATALAIDPSIVGRRVFRYDTARAVWHDVSLAQPSLPSLTDRELEDLLLALPETPEGARAPLMTFYLVGPNGTVVATGDLARSVTFAPEALDAAERQESRRRAEAQRAQAQSRAQSRAAAAAAARAAQQQQQQQQQPQQQPQPTGSVLGRRRQPPTPTPSPTPLRPAVPPGLARQAEASLARLLASPAPGVVAGEVGVPVERVRDILQSDAWLAVVGGDDADASALAARPADPRSTDPAAPSVLDVVDNAVYEFTGVGPEIIAEVVDSTARDPRWTPAVDGPVTPRRVLGVVAAAYDPVVRARSADPDSNASAVILNQVFFALARHNAP